MAPPAARQPARQAIPMAVQVHPHCVCPMLVVRVFGRSKLPPVHTLWLRQRCHLRAPDKNRCLQLLAFDATSNTSTCIAPESTRL